MRQISSGQTQHITYRFAILHAACAVERQNILVESTGKNKTHIREQRKDGEHKEQHSDHHPHTTVRKESTNRLHPTEFLHSDGSFFRLFR
jgi:hypothetical protein